MSKSKLSKNICTPSLHPLNYNSNFYSLQNYAKIQNKIQSQFWKQFWKDRYDFARSFSFEWVQENKSSKWRYSTFKKILEKVFQNWPALDTFQIFQKKRLRQSSPSTKEERNQTPTKTILQTSHSFWK